jgi:hypothetical protein
LPGHPYFLEEEQEAAKMVTITNTKVTKEKVFILEILIFTIT